MNWIVFISCLNKRTLLITKSASVMMMFPPPCGVSLTMQMIHNSMSCQNLISFNTLCSTVPNYKCVSVVTRKRYNGPRTQTQRQCAVITDLLAEGTGQWREQGPGNGATEGLWAAMEQILAMAGRKRAEWICSREAGKFSQENAGEITQHWKRLWSRPDAILSQGILQQSCSEWLRN